MAATGENLRIDGDRLWDSLMEMAKIGPGVAGGNNRQTLTDEDAEAMSYAIDVEARTPEDVADEWIAQNEDKIAEWTQ